MRQRWSGLKAKQVKILILTQSAPIYLAEFLEDFFSQLKPLACEIDSVVLLSPIFKKSTWEEMKSRLELYGFIDFTKMVAYILMSKLKIVLGINRSLDVDYVIEKHSLKIEKGIKINDTQWIEDLKKREIDLIISIACPKIMKSELLSVPKLGSINYHTGMLPKYRGRQPLFWAMLNEEDEVGISVHEMGEGIDTGDLLIQKKVKASDLNSLHQLYLRTLPVGVAALVEAVQKVIDGDTSRLANPDEEATYNSFPEKKEGVLFRQRGKRYF